MKLQQGVGQGPGVVAHWPEAELGQGPGAVAHSGQGLGAVAHSNSTSASEKQPPGRPAFTIPKNDS